ncbi:PadR family transcriptional regulator [Neobacillus novalis]|uniref:PadR family transcriptional regulator n=1 Tax=Neobacillus novalis TaxID=220687 RepID=A0AA95S9C4_9BACI|nr:PadR family transcriptional regulator [Neobacillus novalis]WHY84074.1 PadR family transcriptional regulator [Neobacillus novalis]
MAENMEHSALTEAVYYILLSLYRPMHGYGIMQNIKEISNGRVTLGAGTMYGAINTLLEKDWIQPIVTNEEKSRKKEYLITEVGKEAIKLEILRLNELLKNGNDITGGGLL